MGKEIDMNSVGAQVKTGRYTSLATALGYMVQKLAEAGLRAASTQAARESGEGGSSSVGGGGGHSGGGVGGGSR